MEKVRATVPRPPSVRDTNSEGPTTISGYAAVFYDADDPGTEYKLWDGAVERIMPGAFKRAIKEQHDVRGLVNHDPSLLLGRTTSGTMRLSEDKVGLRYEIDIPDNTVGRDTTVSIQRGDMTGSSFAFLPSTIRWKDDNGKEVREIEDVDLFDVGPVTYPAYEATSSQARTQDYETWKRSKEDIHTEAQQALSNRVRAAEV